VRLRADIAGQVGRAQAAAVAAAAGANSVMRFARFVMVAAALVPAASVARAQGDLPPVPKNFSSIIGVVDDSIRGGRLIGAVVTVVGTDRKGVSDINGIFAVDSIPPGLHQISVTHPLLDTLGLQIVSGSFTLTAGARQQVGAHTPTYEEVRAKACINGGPVSGGRSILVGRVVKADDNEPAVGASVSLLFKDMTKTPAVEKVRSGRVGPAGAFAICGLPSTLTGNLQATLGGVTTPDVPIKSADESMSTVMLSIGGTGSGTSVLKGNVSARGGGPIAGAQVTVAGTTNVAMSAEDGSFTISGLPSGTHEAVVRKIGFAKVSQIVELKPSAPADAKVLLEPATVLGTIHVVGVMENGLSKVGFLARKQHGAGVYLTPEQIAEKNPNLTTDLMRSMNGMRVINANNGRYLTSTSTVGSTSEGCINLFIDHARFDQFQPGDVDDAIPTGDLGAIEYYGTPTTVPSEFNIPGKQCATLVVWTKTLLTTLKP
jgi:hypothetical protein